MPDNEEPGTEAAPTAAAAAELTEQTTELPPANHPAASPEAWSLDDTAEVDSAPPRGRLISAGLVALVVVVAGALIFLATTLFGFGSPKPVEPKAQPTTTVPVAAPTSSPPSTVAAAAPTTQAPALSSTDQQFLSALRSMGLDYPDPAYAISHAHAVCEFLTHHGPADSTDYVARTTVWTGEREAVAFANNAANNYCPDREGS
jgi:Protein of unknown function (DUF732)